MQSLMHFLRPSSLNEKTLTVPSAIVNSFPLSVFHQKRPWKRKKNLSLLWKISLHSGGIQEHNILLIGRAKQTQNRLTMTQANNEALSNKTSKTD